MRTKVCVAGVAAVAIGVVVGVGILMWGSGWVESEAIEHVLDPIAGARPVARPDAPNIVLVIGCTVRRDQTSLYGDVEGTTPFLEELAASGVTFDDVIAAAPWTKAASSAILTGHHPISIGMIEPTRKRNDRVLTSKVATLATYLRGAGYQTIGATANPNLNAVFGFNQGFDEYIQLRELWRTNMVKLEGGYVVRLIDEALDDLDPDRPLYLQVMLVDAHAPFAFTPSDLSMFAEDELPIRVAEYRAALRQLDRVIESLYVQLGKRGFDRSNTVFVIVSDHGEGLEHPKAHGRAHGRFLFPSAVGAVWAMSGPEIPAGHRIVGMASQVDITPTLLGLAGVAGYQGPGLDFSDRVRKKSAATGRQMAFSDTWFIHVNRAGMYTTTHACQRDFAEKRVSDPKGRFREGCFDRKADPLHQAPFPASRFEDELVAWRAARQVEYDDFEAMDAMPGGAVVDQLEALGYVE